MVWVPGQSTCAGRALPEHDQPVLVGERQRSQQNAVDDAINRCRGTDYQSQSDDNDARIEGCARESPNRVFELLGHHDDT